MVVTTDSLRALFLRPQRRGFAWILGTSINESGDFETVRGTRGTASTPPRWCGYFGRYLDGNAGNWRAKSRGCEWYWRSL